MYNFDMTPFAEMIKRDEQLLIALNEWDGKTSSLYKDNLPAFEKFLFELPESLTLPTYRNLRQFLFHELYENHPEKISWKYPH